MVLPENLVQSYQSDICEGLAVEPDMMSLAKLTPHVTMLCLCFRDEV